MQHLGGADCTEDLVIAKAINMINRWCDRTPCMQNIVRIICQRIGQALKKMPALVPEGAMQCLAWLLSSASFSVSIFTAWKQHHQHTKTFCLPTTPFCQRQIGSSATGRHDQPAQGCSHWRTMPAAGADMAACACCRTERVLGLHGPG